LAKKAEHDDSINALKEKENRDKTNWFGVKVGSVDRNSGKESIEGGVGKYLSLKRQSEPAPFSNEAKKQRKIGFGDFDKW